jgi:hypothetical protein
MENDPTIGDLPIIKKVVIFHSYVNVYQMVTWKIGI